MLDKLLEVEKRYMELEGMMSDPHLVGQQREYKKVAKERSDLEEIVICYREWRKVEQEIVDNRQLMDENDEAMRELVKDELVSLRERKEALETKLKFLILPKIPTNNERDRRDSRRYWRRRGGAVCRGAVPHVLALRRVARLAR